MYLKLRNGYWTFTKTLGTSSRGELKKWYNYNYPGGIKWSRLAVESVWQGNAQYKQR